MKNVLFVSYGLGIGGIEKCLVNLINSMPVDEFDIDVLLMNPEFDLKSQIKRNVSFLDSFKYVMNTTDTYFEIKRRGGIIKHPICFLRYLVFRLFNKCKIRPWLFFKKNSFKYDYAIAYSQNDFSPYYLIDKVAANKKYLWYHNGTYEKPDHNYNIDIKYYNKYDKIIAVSNDCKSMLQNKFRFDDNKLVVLHNIVDTNSIIKLANNTPYENTSFNIVTVGRLTKEKGADLAIKVCKKLVNEGFDICWHWVGDGNQRNVIEKFISSYNLDNSFILEGNKSNPYPYIKSADIYVQPSYYEAYSTTITEAKVLCKPIVTTDVGGMREQLSNRENASIVSIDVDSLFEAIKELICDNELLNKYVSNLKNIELINDFEVYERELFSK